MNKKYKVAQIGTFDVENYGDLLFPVLFKYRFSNYDIDLFSPMGGKKPFEEKTIVYSLNDLDKMCSEKKYDALIIGGGDLIRLDNQVANVYKKSYVSSLSLWLLPIVLGKKYNIPVVFNSPGVPYYFDLNQEKIIKTIMNSVDYISVRDRESKKILERAGIKNVNVVPDTILCIDKYITKSDNEKIKNQLIKDKKIPDVDNYIVIQHNKSNINNKLYIKEIKKLIDLIIKKYKYNVLLLPIGYVHNDIDFLNNIYNEKNKNLYIVKNKLTPEEMLSVLSCSKGYV
ncbi:MAG: polysaccharide pyruvyl transferase family protein [Bacilli bacterium]|nr:polysaccharide pyruvyl transferase family protein [Bacilli bacterium]